MNISTPDTSAQMSERAPGPAGVAARSSGFWRAGLLVACSAVFGGIAVVLWNRRTLAQMQAQTSEPPPPTPEEEDAVY